MDVTPRLEAGRQRIQSYGGGGFKISGQRFDGSVFVLPEQVHHWYCPNYQGLSQPDFELIREFSAAIDILLLGCGAQAGPPRDDLVSLMREDKIVMETMETGAACRTFNVLLHEDRRVAAALIAIE